MSSIAPLIASPDTTQPAPLLRGELQLPTDRGPIRGASLRLTALGVVEAWINGAPVSQDVLTPGWSSYEWRIRYADYDVTTAVQDAGERLVLGLALGRGWYHGYLGWTGEQGFYGPDIAASARLVISYQDGSELVFETGDQWLAGSGAVGDNDLYQGQHIDARLRDDRWLTVAGEELGWEPARRVDAPAADFEPYTAPPVQRVAELTPQKVWKSPSGKTLIDFGQNLVGWLKLTVRGEAGQEITVRHAEVLENDELGVRPLRTAAAVDRFILSGAEDEFEPTFTFHGFRYAEVTGWPEGLPLDERSVRAVVVSSQLERIGHFECSDPLLNQLHSNVVWGMRGNFLDVPTDCPQRDERLGWTGDIAVFAPTAAFLFDTRDFLADWLRDVSAEQRHTQGIVPFTVPDILKYTDIEKDFPALETTAIWSDAAVWVPHAIWQAYGDTEVLQQQFESMAAHVRRVQSLLSENGLWDAGFQFGDWLDPDASPDEPWKAKADPSVVATASAYRSAQMLAQIAGQLGRGAEQEEFAGYAAALRDAFNTHYVSEGRIHSDAPTVYALAIVFGLLPEVEREAAGERLAQLVAANGYRVSTGFAGTPFITDALTQTGHVDAAYRLLTEKQCPSWLYPVSMGATTIWERWDSMLPDGSINPGNMTSFNHYALGAVADWMHRTVGGISPLSPGYSSILIAPLPGGGLSHATTSLQTPNGLVQVKWKLDGDLFSLEATVPQGATATLRMPDGSEETVSAGTYQRSVAIQEIETGQLAR
ncbi:family 78 glycoside hydrolase catalytic domain [Glutamicibacter sp. NPDC087344]|uniref:alpha-L-rhamnosidase n=1 Tax=Glutamicibacter sp. NPDC087344 TaxID=3363994 RepID=UPI0038071EAA